MKYEDDKVSGVNIAYIGGGSRGWAWRLMGDMAVEPKLSGTVRLYDIDFDAAHKNEIIGNRLSSREDAKGKWKYKAVKTIGEALKGADFVIISILPGTFKEMASDVHEPEKYGIYQSVGDTVGPGGIIRALRTVGMYVEIAEAIKKYAPNTWVTNYTNPMTVCTRVLYKVFPGIKAFGCCHEVFGTQKLLGNMLFELKGIDNVSRDDIKINVLGINHFTWIDRAYYKGMDLMELYREFSDKYYFSGYDRKKIADGVDSPNPFGNRVKFDLFKRYGLIAAAGDRHLSEFLPPWYLKDPETVHSWGFKLTTVQERVDDLHKRLARSEKLVSGEEQVDLKPSGEEGVRQMKAILGLGDLVTNCNLPNRGQMKGIPEGAVVETNALFSKDSVRPLLAGELPTEVNNLVIRQVLNQETTAEAAVKKDKELAFRAFLNDPKVTLSLDQARELFEKMLFNTKEYLPGWDI